MAFSVTDGFVDRYLAEAKKIATLGDLGADAISKKVDFLVNVVSSGMWTRYAFFVTSFFIAALIVSIAVGIVVGASADNPRPSFVMLSRRSVEARVEGLQQYRSSWIMFVSSIVGAVTVGVLGNFVFHKLSQYWLL